MRLSRSWPVMLIASCVQADTAPASQQSALDYRVSTYIHSLTNQPQFTSVTSVIRSIVPSAQLSSFLFNGVIMSPGYMTTQTWWTAVPSDAKVYAQSAASEIYKLGSGVSATPTAAVTGSKNAAAGLMVARETGSVGWRVKGAVVGVVGAVLGVGML